MNTGEADVQESLDEKIDTATPAQLSAFVDGLTPTDAARTISRLSEEEQTQLLTKLEPMQRPS